jgi:putative phage-type endonuclease
MSRKMGKMTTHKTATTRTEFLKNRSRSIGSSDIPVIMGVDAYRTPLDLFLIKTGKVGPTADNKFTRRGRKLEPVVAEYFSEDSGYQIEEGSEEEITFYHEKEFFSASPDRIYVDDQGDRCILECKTTSLTVDKEEPPLYWFCQLQWQLGVMGLKKGALAWMGNRFEFDYCEYGFQPDFFEEMKGHAEKFWTENVLKDVAPEPTNAGDVVKLYPVHQPDKAIEATKGVLGLFEKLNEARENLKTWKAVEEQAKEDLQMIMKDAEAITYAGATLCTWRTSKPTRRINTAKLKKEAPELYEQYSKESPGTRRFLIK